MKSIEVAAWIILATFELVSAINPPVILRDQVNTRQALRASRTVRLTCPVQGGGTDSTFVEWAKDGEQINFAWSRFRVAGSNLRIKNLMEEDTGRYTCTVTNGFGTDSLEYQVYVYPDTNDTSPPPIDFDRIFLPAIDGEGDPPYFTNTEQMRANHVAPAGSTVRLRCRAGGRPKPQIVWYYNDRMMPPDSTANDEEEGLHSDRWTLKLSDVTSDDSGKYICKVINRAGVVNFTYTLEVVDQLKEHPLLIAPHPQNTTVQYGGMASMMCRVRSDSPPHIQWFKRLDNAAEIARRNDTFNLENQEFIMINTGNDLRQDDGSYLNKLTIPVATEQDAGMYICFGYNHQGYNFRSAYLTVLNNQQPSDRDDSPPLALIIGLPAVILVIIAIAAIYVLCRRRQMDGTTVTVVRRQTPTQNPPAQQAPPPTNAKAPYNNGQPQDKFYDHQYAALRPQPPGQVTTYGEAPYQSGSDNSGGSKNYNQQTPYNPHQVEGAKLTYPQHVTHPSQQPLTHGSQQPNQHLHYHYGC